jgi:hypothetical protein
MHGQRGIRIPRHRSHPGRGIPVGAVAAKGLGKLGLLSCGAPGVHPSRALPGDPWALGGACTD